MSGKAQRDRAEVAVLPPLVYLAGILAGVGLDAVVPLPLPLPGLWRGLGGKGLILLALGLLFWARQVMVRSGQDPDPRQPSPELVGAGPFRYARNPIYIAMALFQLGVAAATANGWIALLTVPVVVIVELAVVRPEEVYLEAKFGDAYRDYRRRVRRWGLW